MEPIKVDKALIENDKLSLLARKLFIYAVTSGDEGLKAEKMILHFKEEKAAIKKAIKELVKNGYIEPLSKTEYKILDKATNNT